MSEEPVPTPDDLIPAKKAANLIVSPKPGCQTALSTVYRLRDAGLLTPYEKRGRLFFSEAEVRGLMQPRPARTRPKSQARQDAQMQRRQAAQTAATLERAGI